MTGPCHANLALCDGRIELGERTITVTGLHMDGSPGRVVATYAIGQVAAVAVEPGFRWTDTTALSLVVGGAYLVVELDRIPPSDALPEAWAESKREGHSRCCEFAERIRAAMERSV